jgi:glucose-6-phosphate 1-dehydrogenase
LNLSIVVLGASGDLAKKKTFPALLALHSKGYVQQCVAMGDHCRQSLTRATEQPFARRFFPPRTQIVGYARSVMTAAQLHDRLRPFLKGTDQAVAAFLNLVTYQHGEVCARVCGRTA